MSLDCPITIWMVSLNRDYSKEEYNAFYQVVAECTEHESMPYKPQDANSFRQIVAYMLPLCMMRHKQIPRSKWRDCVTFNGKHWIQREDVGISTDTRPRATIGYHLAFENSLCGMAITQGDQQEVVNVGLALKQITTLPGVSAAMYAESFSHQLTQKELSMITPDLGDDVVLRRLSIILTLKEAYINAIGQPPNFDWSCLEFNLPEETAHANGYPLFGWEFRIFKIDLGVARKDILVEEQYQCVCAFFRGHTDTKFIQYESASDFDSWIQFLGIDRMVNTVHKLAA